MAQETPLHMLHRTHYIRQLSLNSVAYNLLVAIGKCCIFISFVSRSLVPYFPADLPRDKLVRDPVYVVGPLQTSKVVGPLPYNRIRGPSANINSAELIIIQRHHIPSQILNFLMTLSLVFDAAFRFLAKLGEYFEHSSGSLMLTATEIFSVLIRWDLP